MTKKQSAATAPEKTEKAPYPPVTHEAQADNIIKTPIEARADGSVTELRAEPLAPGEGTPEHLAEAAAHLIAPTGRPGIKIIACESFGDNQTNRSYKPGDEVIGWDRERAEHYQKQGLVTITEA